MQKNLKSIENSQANSIGIDKVSILIAAEVLSGNLWTETSYFMGFNGILVNAT